VTEKKTKAKPKTTPALRQPKPKGLPELKIRPALRLPHDDLIPAFEALPRPAQLPDQAPPAPPGEISGDTSDSTTASISGSTSASTTLSTTDRPTGSTTADTTEGTAEPRRKYVPLDATHTQAEKAVYSVMYRECVTKGVNPRRFTTAELMKLTGINSNTTIIRALRGLRAKLSVEIVSREDERRIGVLYRVLAPADILRERAQAGIVIEPRRKMIVSGPNSTTGSTTASTSDSTTASTSLSSADRRLESAQPDVQDVNNPSLYKNHEEISDDGGGTPSSHGGRDEALLAQVRLLFEQLSNGGTWKDERDLPAFEKIRGVPLWHVIMGLCYSVTRATERRFSSLAYAVPSILQHYETMGEFPDSDMVAIAYQQKRRTLTAIETGKWTVLEWEAGGGREGEGQG
jgi:hypothetical protein